MNLSREQVREIAYQCAGAGSIAVMQLAPDVVMPEAVIIKGVEGILRELAPDAAEGGR